MFNQIKYFRINQIVLSKCTLMVSSVADMAGNKGVHFFRQCFGLPKIQDRAFVVKKKTG